MPPPERLNNQQVAEYFSRIGDLLQILGDNRFKILAYQNAARTIENLSRDINSVYAEGTLRDLPDVGQAIAEKIGELLETGTIGYYDELAEQVPLGVVDMMAVPDVGPKTAARLWKELDIVGVDQLKAAASEGRIRTLKGFGAKSEEKILRGIELLSKRQSGRMPLGQARPLALELIADLTERVPEGAIERIEAAGSLRRWRETIGDLDLLVVSNQPDAVMSAFRQLPQAVDVLGSGETKTSIALPSGLQVDLRVVERKHWARPCSILPAASATTSICVSWRSGRGGASMSIASPLKVTLSWPTAWNASSTARKRSITSWDWIGFPPKCAKDRVRSRPRVHMRCPI